MTRAVSLAIALLAGLGTPTSAAPPNAARTPELKPLPPGVDPSARVLFERHCGADTVSEGIPDMPPGVRLGFATEPGAPARLVICVDEYAAAIESPIADVDDALVFMAYKPFAQFWPAAEARWGSDMELLREELRRAPLDQALENYPYVRMMERDIASVFVKSRKAAHVGDYAQAMKLLEDELARLTAITAAPPGRKRRRNSEYDFPISLLILRIGRLVADAEGPSAGADRIAALLAVHPLDEDYRTNPQINRAAMLAEAGHYPEALAVIEPLTKGFDPSDNDAIIGSDREFSWIMACALKGTKGDKAAEPYIQSIDGIRAQPVDPDLTSTKSNAAIKLRMHKCLGDTQGYAATFRTDPPAPLSPIWLEFQTHGRTINGHRRLDDDVRAALAEMLAGQYRELPESYRPALQAWRVPREGQQ